MSPICDRNSWSDRIWGWCRSCFSMWGSALVSSLNALNLGADWPRDCWFENVLEVELPYPTFIFWMLFWFIVELVISRDPSFVKLPRLMAGMLGVLKLTAFIIAAPDLPLVFDPLLVVRYPLAPEFVVVFLLSGENCRLFFILMRDSCFSFSNLVSTRSPP